MTPDRSLAWAQLPGAVAGRVVREGPSFERAGRDGSPIVGRPEAVLFPQGPEDLQRLVRWARPAGIPIVARGGGSSLDGESVPVAGGVVVDFSEWTRILEIDATEGFARVEPGLSQPALEAELRPLGLSYPPNPGSGPASTLGGHASTNASGPRSLRYGPTRAWVRSLRVVDGRARIWTAGGRSRKRSVGPDLLQLLIGSEGTLALFAELGLRLALRPEQRVGLAIPRPRTVPLGTLAAELPRRLGAPTAALEYVDAPTARAMGTPFGEGEASGGWVLAEVEGSEAETLGALERLEAGREALGLREAPSVFPDADRLWTRRGEAGIALGRALGPSVREDIAVPIGALDRLVERLEAIARRHAVALAVFGHVGEGNLHPAFALAPDAPGAEGLRTEVLDAALELGGTISGEHGIGRTKRHRLAAQIGTEGIDVLRAVKRELDPDGILNPGKLLPDAA